VTTNPPDEVVTRAQLLHEQRGHPGSGHLCGRCLADASGASTRTGRHALLDTTTEPERSDPDKPRSTAALWLRLGEVLLAVALVAAACPANPWWP
jgi:hypothetical protein